MTKTTCPTCGGRCRKYERGSEEVGKCPATYHHILPPDLTKLREIYSKYNDGGRFMYDNYCIAINELWQAIKELLDGDK